MRIFCGWEGNLFVKTTRIVKSLDTTAHSAAVCDGVLVWEEKAAREKSEEEREDKLGREASEGGKMYTRKREEVGRGSSSGHAGIAARSASWQVKQYY